MHGTINKAIASERGRIAELKSLGTKYGCSEEAKKFIDDGKSVNEFRAHLLSKSPAALRNAVTTTPAARAIEGSEAVAKIKEQRKQRFATSH